MTFYRADTCTSLQMKQQRKEVADLIRANKQGNARIRVEAVIRDHQTLQAYELIELFLELMAVRVQLIEKTKEMPSDMTEAMSSLIYASHRLQDFQELVAIRGMLASKYSKEYVTEATSDLMCRKWHVNEDLIRQALHRCMGTIMANISVIFSPTSTCQAALCQRWEQAACTSH